MSQLYASHGSAASLTITAVHFAWCLLLRREVSHLCTCMATLGMSQFRASGHVTVCRPRFSRRMPLSTATAEAATTASLRR